MSRGRPQQGDLIVEGARQHNLKNISVRIPHNAVTVVTGVSGSGKSSLAFDTLYAEGQWRYVESLSTYARMFVERLDRPDVDRLVNIRPAIAIEQTNPVRTARSTVGTTTEIADLLRLLFAKIGRPTCPECRKEARAYQPDQIVDELLSEETNERAMILFPLPATALRRDSDRLVARGFLRVKVGGTVCDLRETASLPDEPEPCEIVLDRLVIRPSDRRRLLEAVQQALHDGGGLCRVEVIGRAPRTYSTAFRCQGCGRTFPAFRPVMFSFNHPLGACTTCKGFGNVLEYSEDLVVPDRTRSLAGGAIEPWTKPGTDWWQKQMLRAMKRRNFDLARPYGELSDEERALIWTGDDDFEGIRQFFTHLEGKRYKLHVRVFLSRYRSGVSCAMCGGTRLKSEVLQVLVDGRHIAAVATFTVDDAVRWLQNMRLSRFQRDVADVILTPLRHKLEFLQRVGLGYLTLDRQTRTLSGGEAQRISLATQLGARLAGTLYVLDEPTIGLHPRDTATLATILHDLGAGGNTVVAVEHDPAIIRAADYLIEMGPAAGEKGGEVVCAAPRREFLRDPRSLTARYLRGDESIPVPRSRRRGNGQSLMLIGAGAHNLKSLSVRIPLGMVVAVTGVSGSGKSTLVEGTLYRALARAFRVASLPIGRFTAIKGLEHLRGVRLIDQTPIGRTPRSNPVTYLKAYDEIRRLFAGTPEARRRGLTPAHFSFNTAGGRCDRCGGTGSEKLEMYFFEDVYVSCEVCRGRRFTAPVLAVRVRGRSIDEVLQMTVDEANAVFSDHTKLTDRLAVLRAVGLGYLRLGQPANTLSGGEAQRLKIAAELVETRRSAQSGGVLYLFDEPTTGLHLDDIKKLLAVLHTLVDRGNTVVVVEHNLEIIKSADWIIDLGPEGGDAGGHIVAHGRPEDVAKVAASHTGRFLREVLSLSAES